MEGILKCSLVAELIDKVKVIGSLERFHKSHNVAMPDRPKDVDFVDGQLLELRIRSERSLGDDLDGESPLILLMGGAVDLPIDSLADGLVQQVVFHQFAHSIIKLFK